MRISVIGTGAIARRGHLPALKLLERSGIIELVAVVDINEELAKKVSREFNVPRYYTDYKDMLYKEEPDVAIICTPTPTHFMIAKDCLEVCNILVEKPLCMKLSQALFLRDKAKRFNRVIGEVYNYRYFPAVKQAYRRVKLGYLGSIVSIYGVYVSHFPIAWTRALWPYHEGGVLYDGLPHLIDIMLLLGGGIPKRISAFGGDYLEDSGFINHTGFLVELDNRVILTVVNSWITGLTYNFLLEIYGTGGFGYLNVRFNTYREYHGTQTIIHDIMHMRKEILEFARSVLGGKFFVGALAHYPVLIKEFIESLEKRTKPPVGIDDSIERLLIIEGVLQSIKTESMVHRNDLLSRAQNSMEELKSLKEQR